MTNQFIEAIQQTAIYQLKPERSTSYYWYSGTRILADRLSISREEMTDTAHKGRNLQHKVIGQILGAFKKCESSPLKQFKPFQMRTNIWQMPSFPSFIGYGTIGISNNMGKIDRDSDIGDLVVLQKTGSDWKEIKIDYFPGGVMDLEMIMEYLYKCIN
ncbi:MAG: hypothetical protein GZ094_01200 [Mariniphaga sp.]|nr:hypothetical protein [Mariniphaga sp.]